MSVARRVVPAAEAAGFALLALVVRALSLPSLVMGDRVHFFGNDAYYHARRIVHALVHFPRVLDRDPYINYPHGGEPIWPPLFDASVAGLLRLLGLDPTVPGELARIEWLLVWIPPVLGAATVACTWVIARAGLGRAAARMAALVLALLPAHIAYTRIGYLDHHAAVSLLGALLLAGAIRIALALGTAPASLRTLVTVTLALGAGSALALLLWPGMLLEIAILEGAWLLLWITRAGPVATRRTALCAAVAHALAAALLAPFALGRDWEVWGSFSPVVLSAFQPWLMATAAVFWSGAVFLGGAFFPSGPASGVRSSATAGSVTRSVVAAGWAFLVVVGAVALAGDPSGSVQQAWSWLARGEAFQAAVAESRPLLTVRGRLSPGFAWTQLTGAFFALPVLLVAALRLPAPAPQRTLLRVVAGWTIVLAAVTLAQTRFFASLSVGLCLLLGFVGAAAWARWRPRRPGPWLAATFLAALTFGPSLAETGRALGSALRAARGLAPEVSQLEERHRLLLGLAAWIRDRTPETSGWLDVEVRPEYAVLSRWTDGHVLEYVARRPSVATNFGDDVGGRNLALSQAWYAADQVRASEILEEVGARYVVLEQRGSTGAAGPSSMHVRLYLHDGQAAFESFEVRGGRIEPVPGPVAAVGRYRLVHETAAKPFARAGRPAFKLYEHVRGAALRGEARPGATVEARIEVTTNRGRSFSFVARARADERGHYAIRLPYWSTSEEQPAPAATVRTSARVRVGVAGRERAVRVSEADVREGRTVAVPSLRDALGTTDGEPAP